jgi:hypothetical protein
MLMICFAFAAIEMNWAIVGRSLAGKDFHGADEIFAEVERELMPGAGWAGVGHALSKSWSQGASRLAMGCV